MTSPKIDPFRTEPEPCSTHSAGKEPSDWLSVVVGWFWSIEMRFNENRWPLRIWTTIVWLSLSKIGSQWHLQQWQQWIQRRFRSFLPRKKERSSANIRLELNGSKWRISTRLHEKKNRTGDFSNGIPIWKFHLRLKGHSQLGGASSKKKTQRYPWRSSVASVASIRSHVKERFHASCFLFSYLQANIPYNFDLL